MENRTILCILILVYVSMFIAFYPPFYTTLDENNFIATHPNRPLDTSVPGIFTCGCAQGPLDIPESVAQASSAAARAAETVMTGGRALAI